MGRWFRYYDETLDDPKVQQLSDSLYRRRDDLLCVACRHGGRITGIMKDLAFMIRQSPAKTKAAVTALFDLGLLDRDGDDYTPHGWSGRQYDSDSSAERMKRHRDKKRDADVTSHPPSPAVTSDAAEQSRDRTEQIDGDEAQARDPKREVLEAIGVWDDARWHGHGGLVEAWMGAGCDLDRDILPTVKAVMAKRGSQDPPSSLKYFDRPVMEALATRTTPPKPGKANGTQGNRHDRPDRSAKLREAVARTFSDVAGESQAD